MKKISKRYKIVIVILTLIVAMGWFLYAHYQYVTPNWSIGIYKGDNILDLRPDSDIINPILQASDIDDVNAKFVADPFLVSENGKWYMFFEIYDEDKAKGVIGVATSENAEKWEYQKVVLEENYHLSYPYVFKWDGDYYMIPEKSASGSVSLYKADSFPYHWEQVSDLIKGSYVDSSIAKYNDLWWIFTTEKGGDNLTNGNLHVFYSENLFSGWKEHAKNPVIQNDLRTSRPGGRILVDGSGMIRFAQDNSQIYGQKVRAFRVNEITKSEYKETELGVVLEESLEAGTWNEDGMHTADIVQLNNGHYLAAVDGVDYVDHNAILDQLKNFFKIDE